MADEATKAHTSTRQMGRRTRLVYYEPFHSSVRGGICPLRQRRTKGFGHTRRYERSRHEGQARDDPQGAGQTEKVCSDSGDHCTGQAYRPA